METFIKRIVSLAVIMATVCPCLCSISLTAEAETVEKVVIEEAIKVDAGDLPDNDELFAGYVEKVLYSDLYGEISTYGNVGADRLTTDQEKVIYSALKAKIEEVASGKLASTEFILNMDFTWSASELGVATITAANYQNLAVEKFSEAVNMDSIVKYMLMDCPYDLYWYDKTTASQISIGIAYDTNNVYITQVYIPLPVAEEYQNGNSYTVNTSLAQSAEQAKVKAASIVAANVEMSDYQKLLAYKNAICELVAYNTEVDSETIYGNPWQIIWVFDEDEDTKVVCEGYSKALQYLCDLSGLTCYTVTGTLRGGTGAGAHMWNIVTLDGKNYLVDLTNCEPGTIGYPDKLFLVGNSEGNVADGYTFSLGYDVFYSYSDAQITLFGNEILTLAAENYTVKTDEGGEEETSTPVTEVFADVEEGEWYVEAVQYVYDKGMMSGSNGAFTPTGNVTRAQVVSTLYKLAGSPKVTDYSACEELIDVNANEWYTDAVCWAYSTGVGTGNTNTKMFNMSNPVTRQQLATFFQRYVGYKGLDATASADISTMLNADKVDSYAEAAVKWAVGAGIISGSQVKDANGNIAYDLAPQASATRAQLASILQKFCKNYGI